MYSLWSVRPLIDAAVTLRLLLNDLISPSTRTNWFSLVNMHALEFVDSLALIRRVVDPLADVKLAGAIIQRV